MRLHPLINFGKPFANTLDQRQSKRAGRIGDFKMKRNAVKNIAGGTQRGVAVDLRSILPTAQIHGVQHLKRHLATSPTG
jgi:hypothetical protein